MTERSAEKFAERMEALAVELDESGLRGKARRLRALNTYATNLMLEMAMVIAGRNNASS